MLKKQREGSALKIYRSSEDYLETMLMLREERGYIRSVDVAERLCVTRPSVSYAVKRLRENGYITMEADGRISLSPTGLEIAQRMYTRHHLLTDFFLSLGVPAETAREDACKVEHELSDASFDAICRLMEAKRRA